jgi:chlorophyll synthase
MDAYLQRAGAIALLARPANVVHPILLVFIGALVSGVSSDALSLYLAVGAIVLIHSAVTMWNDAEDVIVDQRNHVRTILTEGYVSERVVRMLAYSLLALSLVLVTFLPSLAWLIAVMLVILGWLYNAPPFRLSRRPVASMVTLALSYGGLPVLLGASIGGITWQILLLAVAFGASRLSLSLLKDYKDAVGDAQTGKRTFLLVHGHHTLSRWSFGLAAVSNALLVYLLAPYAAAVTGQGIYYAVFGGLYVVTLVWRAKLFRHGSYAELNVVFHQCLYLQTIYDGVMVIWLLAS